MRYRQPARLVACLLALCFLLPACGKKSAAPAAATRGSVVLGDIYELYSSYAKSNSKPPERLDNLKPLAQIAPAGFEAMKTGECVVVWGVKPAKGGKAVLAYEKSAAKEGGSVLLSSGKITTMSASELQAALKEKAG